MHVKNKNITKLKALLYSRTDEGRTTIAQAIGYAVVFKSDILENVPDVRVTIKNVVNEICELAIMDRVVLERTITNMYIYTHIKESIKNNMVVVKYPTDFDTAILLSELISPDVRNSVNKNMVLFNNIVNLLSISISDIVDDDDLD